MKKSKKQLSILSIPSALENEIVFDVDYYSLSKEKLDNLKQSFIQSTARYLNIPEDCVVITSSLAGSWKLNFKLIMEKIGVTKTIGELHDKITYHDYLTELANMILN